MDAWIQGICKHCGSPIVWTTVVEGRRDYVAYCSNVHCKNHTHTELYDDEYPEYYESKTE